jgi:hypothetical protein
MSHRVGDTGRCKYDSTVSFEKSIEDKEKFRSENRDGDRAGRSREPEIIAFGSREKSGTVAGIRL